MPTTSDSSAYAGCSLVALNDEPVTASNDVTIQVTKRTRYPIDSHGEKVAKTSRDKEFVSFLSGKYPVLSLKTSKGKLITSPDSELSSFIKPDVLEILLNAVEFGVNNAIKDSHGDNIYPIYTTALARQMWGCNATASKQINSKHAYTKSIEAALEFLRNYRIPKLDLRPFKDKKTERDNLLRCCLPDVIIDEPLIKLTKCKFENNYTGGDSDSYGYYFNQIPYIYDILTYGNLQRLGNIPSKYFPAIKLTALNRSIVAFLFNRIVTNQPNTINFNSMLDELNIKADVSVQGWKTKAKIAQTVEQILNYWKHLHDDRLRVQSYKMKFAKGNKFIPDNFEITRY